MKGSGGSRYGKNVVLYLMGVDKQMSTKHDLYLQAYKDRVRKIIESVKSNNALEHHGIKGQKWGVRNGPPYPIDKSKKSGKIKIADEKFTKYALDYDKNPNKAKAFKKALGYTKNNYKKLMKDIEANCNKTKMIEKGDNGYGMRYQQVMKLKGPNGKEANVLTAWIDDGDGLKLTSVYVTRKEETK